MATANILERGMMLRDLTAKTLDGKTVRISDFRGRRNVILIFPGSDAEESALASELRQHSDELSEEESVVLTVDGGSEDREAYGAMEPGGIPRAAVYVSDRYGEIFFAAHSGRGESLPSAAELLDWVRFINSQCPE